MKNTIEEAVREYTKNVAFLEFVGYSMDDIVSVIDKANVTKEDGAMALVILSNINEATTEQMLEKVELEVVESFEKLVRRLKMAQGYGEMGDINMIISKEDFHLEDEGARRIDELGNEETDKEA